MTSQSQHFLVAVAKEGLPSAVGVLAKHATKLMTQNHYPNVQTVVEDLIGIGVPATVAVIQKSSSQHITPISSQNPPRHLTHPTVPIKIPHYFWWDSTNRVWKIWNPSNNKWEVYPRPNIPTFP